VERREQISKLFEALTRKTDDSQESWNEFHQILSKRYNEFSECLGKYVPEEELIHLLSLLLIPIARNGLLTAERSQRLFYDAEAMGIHFLPVHFYTPVPDTKSIPGSAWDVRFDGVPGWNLNEAAQLRLLPQLGQWASELNDIPEGPLNGDEFSWNNPAITASDAAIYYAFIRQFRPQRVIEVGSGYSTLLAARACVANGSTRLTCIEPYPMPAITKRRAGIAEVLSTRVQDAPLQRFEELSAGDILFIDSTHVCKIDSDVNYLLLQVVPRLAPGVIVHFHDIFLPWEYAASWVKEKKIFWNEQLPAPRLPALQ
jgi:hypothetical protein